MISNIYNTIVLINLFAKKKISLIFLFFFISGFLEMVGISMVIPIISVLLEAGEKNKYFWIYYFLDENISKKLALLYLILFFLFILILKYLTSVIIEILLVKYTKLIEIDINAKILNYQFIEGNFNLNYQKSDSGKLSRLILTDVPVFVKLGLLPSLQIIKNLFLIILILFLIIFSSGIYLMLFLISVIFIFFCIYLIIKNKFSSYSATYNENINKKHNLLMQFIKGFRTIKINLLKEYFINQFTINEKEIIKFDIANKLIAVFPKIIIEIFFVLSIFGFIYINFDRNIEIVPILGLMAFAIYRCQPSMVQIFSAYSSIKLHNEQIVDIGKILRFITKIPPYNFFIKNNIDLEFKKDSKIIIKNMGFEYKESNNQKAIFSNVNLELQFNKIYGLKGDNGSGKTTFIDLLSSYIQPTEGEILLDDKNIYSQNINWTKYIAYLDQNFFLFNGSIKDNITLQKFNNKKYDKNLYNEVIEITNLGNFIASYPEKDEKYLSGFEKNISGGQKQKLCLARCLYQGSKVLILDEPTSALDVVSAGIFKNYLSQIKKDKLVILITHDANLLKICNHVMEIKDRNILQY